MKELDDLLACFSFDIRPYLTKKTFEPGEVLIQEGEYLHHLFYVAKGRIKSHTTHANGKVSLIRFSEAPFFLGEMELLNPSMPARGATAISTCTCFVIDTTKCGKQLLEDVKFLRHLCLYLSEKSFETVSHYSQSLAYPLENRLAAFLLMAARDGIYREKHTEAAEYLGVTYRHFLYVLADFGKKGYIKKTPQGYILKNIPALQALEDEIRPPEKETSIKRKPRT